jgi:preprotein translocase subunit SecY
MKTYSDLKNRVLITLALLLAIRVLSYLPIPGVELAVLSEFLTSASPKSGFRTRVISRSTVVALGISPYLSASILVVLFLYFRRFRHGVDDRDIAVEFHTFDRHLGTFRDQFGIDVVFMAGGL